MSEGVKFLTWIKSILPVAVGSPQGLICLDSNGDLAKAGGVPVHYHSENVLDTEMQAALDALDSIYAPLSHSHSEYLTQAEIEALPGFGGGGVSFPVGFEAFWPSASAPPGWYIEDGSPVDASLPIGQFLLGVGQADNGDGTVNLFDSRGLVVMSSSPSYALLSGGGSETVTLSNSEMPAHGGHGDAVVGVNSGPYNWNMGSYVRGGGVAHNNLQPYTVRNLIIYGG